MSEADGKGRAGSGGTGGVQGSGRRGALGSPRVRPRGPTQIRRGGGPVRGWRGSIARPGAGISRGQMGSRGPVVVRPPRTDVSSQSGGTAIRADSSKGNTSRTISRAVPPGGARPPASVQVNGITSSLGAHHVQSSPVVVPSRPPADTPASPSQLRSDPFSAGREQPSSNRSFAEQHATTYPGSDGAKYVAGYNRTTTMPNSGPPTSIGRGPVAVGDSGPPTSIGRGQVAMGDSGPPTSIGRGQVAMGDSGPPTMMGNSGPSHTATGSSYPGPPPTSFGGMQSRGVASVDTGPGGSEGWQERTLESPTSSSPSSPAKGERRSPLHRRTASRPPLLAQAQKAAPPPRIDPATLPRPTYTTAGDPFPYETDRAAIVPPRAMSHMVVTDVGNASPRFMRATLYKLPSSQSVMLDAEVPMAVAITPLADLSSGEGPVNCVDFGEEGPPRCTKCSGYVNPFVRWKEHGRTWVCNLCGTSNRTPSAYVCGLDSYGLRKDRNSRPELCHGSVDILAPSSYLVRPPQEPIFVFAVDVSFQAATSGAIDLALQCIRGSLDTLASTPDVRVGIMAYDDSLHFFNCHPGVRQPTLASVTDIDDPFCPLSPDAWLPRLSESRENLETVLELISSFFGPPALGSSGRSAPLAGHRSKRRKVVQSAGGAAIAGIVVGLRPLGGRVVAFMASHPAVGALSFSAQEQARMYGDDPEYSLYAPAKMDPPLVAQYDTLAQQAVEHEIAIDLCCCSDRYLKLGLLSKLPERTGGRVWQFAGHCDPSASDPMEGWRMHVHPETGMVAAPISTAKSMCRTLQRALEATYAWESILRVRTSDGIAVQTLLGNASSEEDPSEGELPGIDPESCIVARLCHAGGSLSEGNRVYIQAALMWTTDTQERRIRVHNLRLEATSDVVTVFRYADLEAVGTYLLHSAVAHVHRNFMPRVRTDLIRSVVEILYAYRQFCAPTTSATQLILPESLKLLPLLVNGMLKSDALALNDSEAALQPESPATSGQDASKASGVRNLMRAAQGSFAPSLGGDSRSSTRPRFSTLGDVLVRADARVKELHAWRRILPGELIPRLYPRLFSLHDMHEEAGLVMDPTKDAAAEGIEPVPGTRAFVVLPVMLWPSRTEMDDGGLYLLDTHQAQWLWMGEKLDDALTRELFEERDLDPETERDVGEECRGAVHRVPANATLPRLDTNLSRRLWNIIEEVRLVHPDAQEVHVVSPQSDLQPAFLSLLPEDRGRSAPSYVDLLCDMHGAILERLESQ